MSAAAALSGLYTDMAELVKTYQVITQIATNLHNEFGIRHAKGVILMGRRRLDNRPMVVRLSPATREYLLEEATARGVTVTAVLRDALTAWVVVVSGGQVDQVVNHG